MQIDTAPPAEFKPEINYIVAATLVERGLVSFLTTDNLSGIDRYEVGAIDKSQPITESPVFMQSESPFQVPLSSGGNLVVIVRAIDKAGNVRDASADIKIPLFITKFIKGYPIYILIFIISIGLVGLIVIIARYLFRHHIVKNDEQPASPKPPQP